jgi:hypothetical protein
VTPRLPEKEKQRRRMTRLLTRRRLSRFEKEKCADRTCGKCIRCVRSRSWALGKYANKKPSLKADIWMPEHEERLRQLAGTMDRKQLAETLSREFPDAPRTVHAVSIRAQRLGISLWPPGRSLWEISKLLGVSDKRILTWISLGWLEAFPYEAGAGVGRCRWRVHDDALQAFLRAHGEQYDPKRVKGTSPMANLARLYARGRVPQRLSVPPRTKQTDEAAA